MTKEQIIQQIEKDHKAFVHPFTEGFEEESNYQHYTKQFLFSKLAEIELRLRAIEEHTSRLDSENSLNRPLM